MRTEHVRQFRLLHVQQIPRLVVGVLHCLCQFVYIEAVVAQELKHHTLWAASLAQRMWCAIKAEQKIFQE